MQYFAIIVIGLIALAVQFMFERRRTRTAREFENKRLEAEKEYWASRHLAVAELSSKAAKVLAEAQQKAQMDMLTSETARKQEAAASVQQRRAFDTSNAKPKPTARFNIMNDRWEDRDNNPIMEPPRHLIDKDGFYYGPTTPKPRAGAVGVDMAKGPDRAYFNPDSFGIKLTDPRKVGASISTVDLGYESEQETARRRQAVDAAMFDAQMTGLGVVRMSEGGQNVEHVPVESIYKGGGGSFDGGGASGDYSASTCSSSSSSSSSDSGSSSSCSSSDSGGGSSSSD